MKKDDVSNGVAEKRRRRHRRLEKFAATGSRSRGGHVLGYPLAEAGESGFCQRQDQAAVLGAEKTR